MNNTIFFEESPVELINLISEFFYKHNINNKTINDISIDKIGSYIDLYDGQNEALFVINEELAKLTINTLNLKTKENVKKILISDDNPIFSEKDYYQLYNSHGLYTNKYYFDIPVIKNNTKFICAYIVNEEKFNDSVMKNDLNYISVDE